MKPLLLKFPVALLLLLLIAGTSNSQLINKKEFRLKDSKPGMIELNKNYDLTSKTSVAENKSLLFAGALSFVVPGMALGQFYKEEFINGGIRLGISILCIIWFSESPTFDVGGGGDATQKLIAAGIYAVNWIASIIDASSNGKKPANRKFNNYNVSF